MSHAVQHTIIEIAGGLLYPFVHGYMNAKYLKKMHVSRFRGHITLVYARASGTTIVISADEAKRMDQTALASWFHSQVASLNPTEVIPPLVKFEKAAEAAQKLARGEASASASSVPLIALPVAAI